MTAESRLRSLLPRLDAAIAREIARLRGRYQLSLDEFRGLYVSDARVDALLRSVGIEPDGDLALPDVEPAAAWSAIIAAFELDPIEADLLLLALADELDARYPTLFAYLNDDVSARRPTVDLALRLFGRDWDGREAVRERLRPYGRLARSGLVLPDAGAAGPSAQMPFAIAPVAACHLLGGDALAAAGLEKVRHEDATPDAESIALANWLGAAGSAPVLLLAGREGTGRSSCAAALANCLGRPLAAFSLKAESERPGAIATASLACRMTGSLLLIDTGAVEPDMVAEALLAAPRPLLLRVTDARRWERAFASVPTMTKQFAIPDFERRRAAWRDALRARRLRAPPAAVDAVAGRFRLSDGLIRRATRDADGTQLYAGATGASLTKSTLMHHARRQCALELDHLATRVAARPAWEDLVLPAEVQRHLRDFAAACAERDRVYESWGMAGVGRSSGRGLAALFAGASGTGKTMSAAVIAHETDFDLWRIDLSSVVSKYIGETEKNLDRIFTVAQDGDVILFFDEADAIFGKRSEVRDAHDRYSNIEVAYLLQKIEDYSGIVILASNFIRNIDQAFTRRLNYIVEFPLPDARLRERLWQKAFAPATPVRGTIDHGFLGREFALSGGDIRAASLDAAFLAASNGGAVTMDHIMRAVSRQMLKQGKVPSSVDRAAWATALADHSVRANGHAS